MGGTTHNMVVKPSLGKAIFNLKSTQANNRALVWYMLEHFFGSRREVRDMDETLIFKNVHGALNVLMKESYLDKAMPVIAKGIAIQTQDLVTFKKNRIDQTYWEQSGDAKIVPDHPHSVEVSLFPLIRTFTASIATPALMGTAFIKNYPDTISDLWDFDVGLPFFMMRLPHWIPLPGYRKAQVAQKKLLASVTDLYIALKQVLDGKEPDPRWDDLSDVSEVLWERVRAWELGGLGPEIYGGSDFSVLWA